MLSGLSAPDVRLGYRVRRYKGQEPDHVKRCLFALCLTYNYIFLIKIFNIHFVLN